MNTRHEAPADLPRNQALVYTTLARADGPLTAYAILEKVRDKGVRAPLQVYRALDKLIAAGIVHRLESLNAFVACRQPESDSHETAIFSICEVCGSVTEAESARLTQDIDEIVGEADFRLRKSTVELRGICRTCRLTSQ
jgi:Fur family zinc uptake transcriptional regulator